MTRHAVTWHQPTLWEDADDEARIIWLDEHRLKTDERPDDTDQEDRP